MIKRRPLLQAGLAWPMAVAGPVAAAPARVARIVLVSIGTDPSQQQHWQPLRDALRQLGHVEGHNLLIETAFAAGDAAQMPGLLAAALRTPVDVIVTTGVRETQAARQLSARIPIVMLQVPDPVAQGLVTSLGRPGGNVTGLTNMVPGLSQKYIEFLHEVLPAVMQMAVLASGPNPVAEHRRELDGAAAHFGVKLRYLTVQGPNDFEPVLRRARLEGVGAIIATLDPVTQLHRKVLLQVAQKQRLPGIFWSRDFVVDGGLMTYSANTDDLRRRGAAFVDRILKGAKPADLPVEQPTRFELVPNLKAAAALGLTIPHSLLLRADEVIQ